MYVAMGVILTALTLSILFIGLYRAKNKELARLQARIHEQEDRERQHNADMQENISNEKKRRDLIEIYLVSDAKPDDCEKIYSKLVESGKYGDFFYAKSKKARLQVLQKLK